MLDLEIPPHDCPAETGADASIGATSSSSLPGSLRGDISITLHTIQAVRIFEGRRPVEGRPGIPGLYRFDHQLNRLAAGSAVGDPHADWCLIRIEQCLDNLRPVLTKVDVELTRRMSDLQGLSISIARSIEPRIENLRLSAPHAYLAAHLITRFDHIAKLLLTLTYVGIIDRRERGMRLGRLQRRVRRPMYLAEHYHFAGVTRQDVQERNESAREAARTRAKLPQAVVDGVLAPRFFLRPKWPIEAPDAAKVALVEPSDNALVTSHQQDDARVSA